MGQTAQAYALDRLYSLDEFEELDLPADGSKYELIEGELHVSPPAGDEHGRIGTRIVRQITLFDPDERLGRFWQATRFQVAPGFGPAPDVAFISAAHLPPTSKGAVTVRPDLVVEVWSPGDLDTRAHREQARSKIRRYQVAGVSIVWAINPSNQTVEVYHPTQVNPAQVLGVTDELSGEDVIPGFRLAVRSLFD
jgi:Uma2 family endonuclease